MPGPVSLPIGPCVVGPCAIGRGSSRDPVALRAHQANVTAMGAITSRKTQCQDQVEVSHPATGGPITEGSTQAAETQLKTLGRRASGYARPITTQSATTMSPAP